MSLFNTNMLKPYNLVMIVGIAIAAHMLLIPLYAKVSGKDI